MEPYRSPESPRARLVEALGDMGSELGVNRVAAEMYALLYLQEGPLSLDELTARLAVSKATVSLNVRALEGRGAVRRVRIGGSRKAHYVGNRDILGIVLASLQEGLARRLARLLRTLDQLERETASPPAETDAAPPPEEDARRALHLRIREARGVATLAERLVGLVSDLDPRYLELLLSSGEGGGGAGRPGGEEPR